MAELPILLCYDGSADSRRAIEGAARLLGPRSAVVVDVSPTMTREESLAVVAGEMSGGEVDILNDAAALAVATEGAERAREAGFAVEARSGVASPTWEGIVDAADEIDAALLVVGSRDHSSFRGRLQPSTSHDLAVHAGRPVLIVPATSHD